jgi:hypothetical protein
MAYYALKKDVFDIDKITVVGSPNITSDGVVTTTSGYSGNCPYIEIPALGDNWEMVVPFNWKNATSRGLETFFRSVKPSYNCFSLGTNGVLIYLWLQDINQSDIFRGYLSGFSNYTNLLTKITCTKNIDGYLISVLFSNDDGKNWNISKTLTSTVAPYICQNALTYQAFVPTLVNASATMDLTKFKYSKGTVSYSPTKPAYLLERRKEGYDPSKFTIVGSPTITEYGVASGFSGSNYVTLPISLSNANSWKIILKNNSLYGDGYLFGGNILNSLAFFKGAFWISSNGTSWDIANNLGSRTNIPANSLIQLEFTGAKYIAKYSVDNGSSWVVTGELTSNVKITSNINTLFIGKIINGATANCSINLPSISITVDGKEVFTGAKEVYYAMEK